MLVVEGDLDTREMYAEWLVYSGLRVVEATQTQEAIKKARRLRPNLITTDIEIEDGRGLDFCTKLKESKRTKNIPVIAVTGWAMGNCVERARRAGCDLVLVKPCLPETLLAEIQRLLNLPVTSPKPTDRF